MKAGFMMYLQTLSSVSLALRHLNRLNISFSIALTPLLLGFKRIGCAATERKGLPGVMSIFSLS